MVNDWPLPASGQSLFSFIGLVNFYHKYAPYMEMRLKLLHKLVKAYYRKPITSSAWTPEFVKLFSDLKSCITSSPVLARFDPAKPTFFKTDWSSEGMGWILMQPADDEESKIAMDHLQVTGNCLFDLSLKGARLKPVVFGSRSCSGNEHNFHSFTGEAACGRWAIGQNRKYLWGNHFFWMCDCSAMKEIFDYGGNIPMVCCWAQELLSYMYSVLHRSHRMMIDVDALTRRFGPLIATHCNIAKLIHDRDVAMRPLAYESSTLHRSTTLKLTPPLITIKSVPILSSTFLKNVNLHEDIGQIAECPLTITTIPILFLAPNYSLSSNASTSHNTNEMLITQVDSSFFSEWWCIDDTQGSTLLWSQTISHNYARWNFRFLFCNLDRGALFKLLNGGKDTEVVVLKSLLTDPYIHSFSFIDIAERTKNTRL